MGESPMRVEIRPSTPRAKTTAPSSSRRFAGCTAASAAQDPGDSLDSLPGPDHDDLVPGLEPEVATWRGDDLAVSEHRHDRRSRPGPRLRVAERLPHVRGPAVQAQLFADKAGDLLVEGSQPFHDARGAED